MPPKPFKPPRPSAVQPKKNSKPASGTSSTSRKHNNTTNTSTNSKGAGSRSKPILKAAKGFVSAAGATGAGIPSLSPDSSPVRESAASNKRRRNQVEEEEEDDDSAGSSLPAEPSNFKPKPKRPSSTTRPRTKTPRTSLPSQETALDLNNSDDEAENDEDDDLTTRQQIPTPLLTLLLQTFLAEQGNADMRVGREAIGAVGKYLDTFVREAVARAAFGREERLAALGVGEGAGGFLEVEDLERLGPQLLLDF